MFFIAAPIAFVSWILRSMRDMKLSPLRETNSKLIKEHESYKSTLEQVIHKKESILKINNTNYSESDVDSHLKSQAILHKEITELEKEYRLLKPLYDKKKKEEEEEAARKRRRSSSYGGGYSSGGSFGGGSSGGGWSGGGGGFSGGGSSGGW